MKHQISKRYFSPFLLVILILTAVLAVAAPTAESAASGFRVLTGTEAAAFKLPGDVFPVKSFETARGWMYERYQQIYGASGAEVLGGQLSLYRQAGVPALVIGSHYPNIRPANRINLTAADARQRSAQSLGPGGERTVNLLINPLNGRYFYQVETRRADSRWIQWIDAGHGRIVNAYDGLTDGSGIGVLGDTKDLTDLTTYNAGRGEYEMISADGRQTTYMAGIFLPGTPARDSNDDWDASDQRAAVDAHYYANLTDDYYQSTHGFNWLDHYSQGMVSSVHYWLYANNAAWNGEQMAYGDGDGISFRDMSGDPDVVGHEFTHGVTEATSNLVYQDESGALNESFSDIMGTAVDTFYGTGDWTIGEDIHITGNGIRNMADPQEDGDPDHYSERQIGGGDNGGVHTNSGIPNHAFYLLVVGGQNAGCDAIGSGGHQHTADCDVIVSGIGLAAAEQIFYAAFTGLPSNATMTAARDATVGAANTLYGGTACTSTVDAWQAVGVGGSESCGPPNNPPMANDDGATTSEDTPVTIDAAANDTDPDGNLDPTSAAVTSGPTDGTTTNNGDGSFVYTPNPNFNGNDSFTYEICDTGDLCDTAVVYVEVISVNDPPTANDDSATTDENIPVSIDVAANDTDVDGNLNPTTAAAISAPANGSTIDNGDGTISYTPDPGYTGIDTFTYEICDTGGLCDTALVTVDITPVNYPPVANNDSATTAEDTPMTVDADANDTDPDGNLDPASATVISGPANGATFNNGDGSFVYDPYLNFNGNDSFTYEICDTGDLCDTAVVYIEVTAVNDPPAAGFAYTCTGLSCTFTSTSTDIDSSILTYAWNFGDGNTGSGATVEHTYGTGDTYDVSLTVTDDGGLDDSVTQSVTVSDAEPTTLHSGDLDGGSENQGKTWVAAVTIIVHDAAESPVSGATVSGSWSGTSGETTCTTDASGACTVQSEPIAKKIASVDFSVADIVYETWTYAPIDNHEPDGDSDGTTVTVPKDAPAPPPPPDGTSVHIGDLDGSTKTMGKTKWKAIVTATVHDDNHNPVANATVTGSWSGAHIGSGSCTTDNSGQCSISTPNLDSGTDVTFTVDGITHATLAYEAADNHDDEADSDGNSIDISRP